MSYHVISCHIIKELLKLTNAPKYAPIANEVIILIQILIQMLIQRWSSVGARFERQGEDGAGLRGHAELCRSHHSREDLHAAVPKTKGLKKLR